MVVTLNIKLVNPHFSQTFANEHHRGKESEDNIHYVWEDELEVKGSVKEFKILNNQTFSLAGEFPDGKKFNYEIPAITLIQCELKNGSYAQFPISAKLIQRTEKKTDKEGNITFQIFLKGNKDFVSPMEGAYILKKDFPLELIPYLPKEEDEDEDLDSPEELN
jgi:hypothetical protein